MRSKDGVSALARGVATVGWVGFTPRAPGTAGSAVAFGLYQAMGLLALQVYVPIVAGLFLVGVWAAGRSARQRGVDDPSEVVIDEVVGYLLALTALPYGLGLSLFALVAFRVFDIMKPFRRVERLAGGWGIMVDDCVAGGLTHVAGRLFMALVER